MADKNSKSKENSNEVIDKYEGQIVELKNKISDLEAQNGTLMERIKKLEAKKSFHQFLSNDMPSKKDSLIKRRRVSPKMVPNWLVEVLAWIDRIEMANSSLSTACATFRQLCWPKLHGNVKPHGLSELYFRSGRSELGQARTFLNSKSDGLIPIATIPPPDYIISASWISLSIFKMDDQVLNFLKNIEHLLQNCMVRVIWWNENKKVFNNKAASNVFNILSGKIFGFEFLSYSWLTMNDFDEKFPGFFDSLQLISFVSYSNFDTDFLVDWLNKPRKDGKQKLIKMLSFPREFESALIRRIIQEFLHSTLPSTFTINFAYGNFNFNDEFIYQNVHTNEFLTLYSKMDANYRIPKFHLARYPKGGEEWKEEGEKKIRQSEPKYI